MHFAAYIHSQDEFLRRIRVEFEEAGRYLIAVSV